MEKYKNVLFNPFEKVAGFKALASGITIIILTGIAGYFADINFDGVLDAHFLLRELSFASHLAEGIVNWLCLSIFLLITGLIFSKTKFRIIDVFGTQALARWPMLITAILALVLPVSPELISQYILWKTMGIGEEVVPGTAEIIVLTLFIIISVALSVLMAVLMYKAYSVSFNIKKFKGIISFLAALIFAEIVSKYLLVFVYKYLN